MGVFTYYLCLVLATLLAVFGDLGIETYYSAILAFVTICLAAKRFFRKRYKSDTQIQDFPEELLEMVLARVPVTSLRRSSSVCTQWQSISTTPAFISLLRATPAIHRLFVMRKRLLMLSFVDGFEPRLGEIDVKGLVIKLVFHCNGLVLGITHDFKRFVVFNPIVGQMWCYIMDVSLQGLIHFSYDTSGGSFAYALGYEDKESGRLFKFLKVPLSFFPLLCYQLSYLHGDFCGMLIHHSRSSDMLNSETILSAPGVSVKGNTYFYAQDKLLDFYGVRECFLICFNFTREKFGPRLDLPFVPKDGDVVLVSTVGEDELAILFQCRESLVFHIWLTRSVDPSVVVWKEDIFLSSDMTPMLFSRQSSFVVHEEKNTAVVFDGDEAYTFGQLGLLKKLKLKVYASEPCGQCSYVPSSAQI